MVPRIEGQGPEWREQTYDMQRMTEPYLRDCHATRLFEGPILDDGDLGLDNDHLDAVSCAKGFLDKLCSHRRWRLQGPRMMLVTFFRRHSLK